MNQDLKIHKENDSYFRYYGNILNQQNIIQDIKRTEGYYNSIMANQKDFENKIVMDIGAGSGILSLFVLQAGAAKVYAIEESNSVYFASDLIRVNDSENKITIIKSKVEDLKEKNYKLFVELKNSVDVIISEPFGILLFNERMIESFIYARDNFLKKDGKMYPSMCSLYFVPFSDDDFYCSKINELEIWKNNNFYGINMTSLYEKAHDEKFSHPYVGPYNPKTHVTYKTCVKNFDLNTIQICDITNFEIDLVFNVEKPSVIHGIASWFEIYFIGSDNKTLLSTSPFTALTHWYQTRLLLKIPIAINPFQIIQGVIKFESNEFRSYDLEIILKLISSRDSLSEFSSNYCVEKAEM